MKKHHRHGMLAIALLLLTAMAVYAAVSIQDKQSELPQCEGISFSVIDMCSNPIRQPINNMQPTLDISISNQGQRINGFVIVVRDETSSHPVKIFRNLDESQSAVISIPAGEMPAREVALSAIINKDSEVFYCNRIVEFGAKAIEKCSN